MSKKIFITRKIPDIGIKMLRDKGYEVDISPKDKIPSQKDIIRALKEKPYDAVLTLLTDHIDAAVYDAAPQAKIFASFAIGYDNIDIKEAKKRGIFVSNAPGTHADAIAEHAIALMLGLTTRMVEADRFVRKGKYKGWSPMHFIGTDLKGKTVGILGVGKIGERVAHHLNKGFDSKIIYYDVARNEKVERDYGAKFLPTVDEVMREADIVTIHVPLLDSTRHLVNADRLKMMKPTSFLVNTSRGPVVDEKALVEALKKGVIRGAGLDVYEFEPKLAPGLAKLENVVLTPHIASARESARNEMAVTAAENIIDCMEGRQPRDLVNK